jgi:hypothetical protein
MQENMKRSAFMRFLNKIWPVVYKVINMTVFFVVKGLRDFFRDFFSQLLKGG